MVRQLLTTGQRQFRGEPDAKWLLKVLNGSAGVPEGRQRVLGFLANLQQFVEYAFKHNPKDISTEQRNEMSALKGWIDHFLSRWHGSLAVVGVSVDGMVHFDMAVAIDI